MINFFWIFFFGSVTPLTENPIDIVAGTNEIQFKRPISAITSAASMEVNITSLVPASEKTILKSRQWAEVNFPKGCINVLLFKRGYLKPQTHLTMSGIGFSNEKIFIILSNPAGVPTRENFDSIKFDSCKPLNDVRLTWKNYRL